MTSSLTFQPETPSTLRAVRRDRAQARAKRNRVAATAKSMSAYIVDAQRKEAQRRADRTVKFTAQLTLFG